MRAFVFGLIAVAGAGWALLRHYTHPLAPLRVQHPPAAAPTYDPEAGELPVPELLPLDPSQNEGPGK